MVFIETNYNLEFNLVPWKSFSNSIFLLYFLRGSIRNKSHYVIYDSKEVISLFEKPICYDEVM